MGAPQQQQQQQQKDLAVSTAAGYPTSQSASSSSTPPPAKGTTAAVAATVAVMGAAAAPQTSPPCEALLAFLVSKGLGAHEAERVIEVTDADSVEDLKMIDPKMADEVVQEVGLGPLPAEKLRALLRELRGEAQGEPGDAVACSAPQAEPAPPSSLALQECIAICIDRSGSMGGEFSTERTRMEAVKQMFYAFRDRTETVSRGAHQIGLIQFDDKVEQMLELSSRLDRFEAIVDDMEPRDLTAIYSAVVAGARMLEPIARHSPEADLRVLVLTDGQSNTGATPTRALRAVSEISAVVDAIIVGDQPDENLRRIVAATGGECYQIADLGEGFELLEAEGVVSLRARRGGGPKPAPPADRPAVVTSLAEFERIEKKDLTRGTAVKRAPALAPALAQKRVVDVEEALSGGGSQGGNARAMKRITMELAKVADKNPAVWMHSGEGVHIFPAAEDLFLWRALLEGPTGSPFEGGVFALNVLIPQDYPHRPPQVTFETPVYHCNVSDSGKVCLDLLYDSWSPTLTVPKVLEAIRLLLKNPDTDNALRQWIAELTIAHLRLGEVEYFEKAREATRRDAQLSVAGWQQHWTEQGKLS